MNLKLDEHLGATAARIFQQAGHDVHTVREEGLSGTSDHALLDACRAERRCLVTLDREIGNVLMYVPSEYSGIALLRPPRAPTHADLLKLCNTLIAGLARDEILGKLWVVERGRIRIHRPDSADDM